MEEPVNPETPAIEGTRNIRVPVIPKPPKSVEETGLTLGRVAAFRAYYFQETPEGTRSGARKRSVAAPIFCRFSTCWVSSRIGRRIRFV